MQNKRPVLFLFSLLVVLLITAITSPTQTLTTLVNFNGENGSNPGSGPLVQGNDGNFYGTTREGGSGGYNGSGTVFKMTPGGMLTTLYNFCTQPNCSDGAQPYAGLVQGSDGNFDGTTWWPLATDWVFKITPQGALTTLSMTPGGFPFAAVVQGTDGNFYGTTASGGSGNVGTVFKITPSGTLTTLHSFEGYPTDGAAPGSGALVQAADGNFYGTTQYGGAHNGCIETCGTVFKITPQGAETTLYSFSCPPPDCPGGFSPAGGLVQGTDGNFYGTTQYGGDTDDCPYGCGTVFRITAEGILTTLYVFHVTDGAYPVTSLLQATDGNFYGTTTEGGDADAGTLFRITAQGALTTLYSFCKQGSPCADGAFPNAQLAQATDGSFYGTTPYNGIVGTYGTVFKLQVPPTLTVAPIGNGSVTSTDGFISCPGTCSHTYSSGTQVTLNATPGQGWVLGGWNGACVGTGACTLTMTQSLTLDAIFSQALQFVSLRPCRLYDTRPSHGGGGPIQEGTAQAFDLPQLSQAKGCGDLSSASAYSLNITVIPHGSLGYLTLWPTGEGQPTVSTLNSVDGRVKANAAITPAGTDGQISVYVTNTTDVVIDIDGYFAPVTTSTLAFYPLTPCRVVDTRKDSFLPDLGPPALMANTPRDLPVRESSCIPADVNPQAYSFNFTAVPINQHPIGYLSVWPTGQSQPVVSTLNDQTGTIVANAAIVPAGTGGYITVFATDDTQLLIDINGYFAMPTAQMPGLSLYALAPCRALDTRHRSGGQPFNGPLTPPLDVVGGPCGPPATAQAYVFNATVVPTGSLGYLALWPDGEMQPVVSTLNALDGAVTNNMAIVPTNNGSIDAYANGLTQLLLDISSYFAP